MITTYDDGHEIEFITVGDGECSGDAICFRYKNGDSYHIGIVDGGTKKSGQLLVDHVKKHYNTSTVDFVINTHPDGDHASGLTEVLEQLEVKKLWMHRPWERSADILELLDDDRVSEESLEKRIQKRLKAARELEQIALRKKISIEEPFEGKEIGAFTCVGPSEAYYNSLVAQFRDMPKAKEEGLVKSAFRAIGEEIRKIAEGWGIETLKEDGVTAPENNSSVILVGKFKSKYIMLNGDAGVESLNKACDYIESRGISFPMDFWLLQVPHHGSRNNVSPSLLDRLVGPKMEEDQKDVKKLSAYVSASPGSSTHPRKSVLNAFNRRGARVYQTAKVNGTIRHAGIETRDGWSTIEPLPFYHEVED